MCRQCLGSLSSYISVDFVYLDIADVTDGPQGTSHTIVPQPAKSVCYGNDVQCTVILLVYMYYLASRKLHIAEISCV